MLITLLSVVFLPYWIYLPMIFAAVVVFPFYWEAIILAVFIEEIYGTGDMYISLAVIFLLIIMLPLRDRIRL